MEMFLQRVVAQPARWTGCRGWRGGAKGGAAQAGAAVSCLPVRGGSTVHLRGVEDTGRDEALRRGGGETVQV